MHLRFFGNYEKVADKLFRSPARLTNTGNFDVITEKLVDAIYPMGSPLLRRRQNIKEF